MSKAGRKKESITVNQYLRLQKKMKTIFGHLDYNKPPAICPVRDILSVASDKWSILIVLHLGAHKILRFNKLKKMLYGVSSKTMSEKLKLLEIDGYITRKQYAEMPIRVEYQLTIFGMKYAEKLIELTEWMDKEKSIILKKRNKA